MRLVYHHKVIGVPAQAGQIGTVGFAMCAAKVGVIEHLVVEPILRQRVVSIVVAISIPVVCEFFRAEDEHAFIARFVILYHRKGGEGFAETYGVGQNAAVVFFQLVYDGKSCVTLKVKQHLPDLAVLEAGGFVGQSIVRDIVEKLIKNVVERNEIDKFRRIFVIYGGNALDYLCGDILKVLFVIPQLLKQVNIAFAHRVRNSLREIVGIVAALAAQIHRCKLIEGEISVLSLVGYYVQKAGDDLVGGVGFECDLLLYPLSALFGNGLLRQLIAEPDFKFCAIEILLAREARNIELALGLLGLVRCECRRGKNEFKLIYASETFLEFLVGINREAGSGYSQAAFLRYSLLKVVPDTGGYIVNQLRHLSHSVSSIDIHHARALLSFHCLI